MREAFLLMEGWRSIQEGRSRERQLEMLDFLDSIEILMERWAARFLLSIKNELSDFVKSLTLIWLFLA